jgi:hypothetical protein
MKRINVQMKHTLQSTKKLLIEDFIKIFTSEMQRQAQVPINIKTKTKTIQFQSSWYKPSQKTKRTFRKLQKFKRLKDQEQFQQIRKKYQQAVKKENDHNFNSLWTNWNNANRQKDSTSYSEEQNLDQNGTAPSAQDAKRKF